MQIGPRVADNSSGGFDVSELLQGVARLPAPNNLRAGLLEQTFKLGLVGGATRMILGAGEVNAVGWLVGIRDVRGQLTATLRILFRELLLMAIANTSLRN
jgi:hypothetical protein